MSTPETPTQRADRVMSAVEHRLNTFAGPLDELRHLQHQADQILARELQALPKQTAKEVAALEADLADAERAYAGASGPLDRLERQENELHGRLRAAEKALDAAVGAGELDGTPMSAQAFAKMQSDLARLRSALAEASDRRQRASLARVNATGEVIRARRELLRARERLAGEKRWAADKEAQLDAWHQHPEDRLSYS